MLEQAGRPAERVAVMGEVSAAAIDRLLASLPYRGRVDAIAAEPGGGRALRHTMASAQAAELARAYAELLAGAAGPDEASPLAPSPTPSPSPSPASSPRPRRVRSAAARTRSGAPDFAAAAADASSASRAAVLQQLAEQRMREGGHYRSHGFAASTITRDPRWRAMAAVREAGLLSSAAATRVLAAFTREASCTGGGRGGGGGGTS